MVTMLSSPGDYQIEVSGWGLDNSFFVERTNLVWTPSSEKTVQLHRALPEGAVIFVRLLAAGTSNGTVPVAFQVEQVGPMDRNGRCQMKLTQLHPRSKKSPAGKRASNRSEDSQRQRELREVEKELAHEEILR